LSWNQSEHVPSPLSRPPSLQLHVVRQLLLLFPEQEREHDCANVATRHAL
jgi:hypothetical protein